LRREKPKHQPSKRQKNLQTQSQPSPPLKTTPLIFGSWIFGPFTFAARNSRPASITSVTRWLLVVVGCAVLAMAQPMSAAPEADSPAPEKPAATPAEKSVEKAPAEKPAATDKTFYPRNSSERPADALIEKSAAASNAIMLLAALALAAGGVWVFVQRRQNGTLPIRGQRKLQIEETRPLGGRQYLIVANYDGKKFLLGVTPGKINLLTPLGDESAGPAEKKP
jgi:flagellar protein FliO/FliZ